MDRIKATVTGRRLERDVPADWPDGLVVEIHPLGQAATDDDGPMSPDEIAGTRAAMDRIEPFDLTDDEAADLDAWEREVKDR